MLRFILLCDILINSSFSFQYIPCYGLSTLGRFLSMLDNDFNTSHVTVYRNTMYTAAVNVNHFNTSHVTVYPCFLFLRVNKSLFQYIPCYGLSQTSSCFRLRRTPFQYIPCYGLSNDFKPFLSWHLSSFPLFYVISAFFTSRL